MAGGTAVEAYYTITKTDGSVLTVNVDRKEKGGVQVSTTGTIGYDASREAPTWLKTSSSATTGGAQSDINLELKLVSDSAAQSSSTNSH